MSIDDMTAQTTLVRSENLITSELDDELVMMSLEKNAYFGLDDIGKMIWELLAQPKNVADLCQTLTERFEIDIKECESDVIGFLSELYDEGIVHIV